MLKLTDQEKQAIVRFIEAGKELPEKYRFLLFEEKRQADARHGSAIAEQLSNDLQAAFPGISGFSWRNIFYMREFYLLYHDDDRVQPLVAQIGWIHKIRLFLRQRADK